MENFVLAAGIGTGARTLFDKRPFVSSQEKNLLSFPDRIMICLDRRVHLPVIHDDFAGLIQLRLNGSNRWRVGNMVIDIEFGKPHAAKIVKKRSGVKNETQRSGFAVPGCRYDSI